MAWTSAPSRIHHPRYTIDASDDPDPELAHEPAHEPDRAEQREHGRDTPKTSFHSQAAWNPNTLSESAAAAVAITISSKIAQPRHWSTFSPVARYEPRRPSGARCSTIVGTPASAPISAATRASALPTSPPTSVAASACRSERSK